MQKIYIKNMVCGRCVRVVKEELEAEGIILHSVELGEVHLRDELSQEELEKIRQRLVQAGFELIDDQRAKLIEQIKTLIIEEIHHQKGEKKASQNFSDFLIRKTGKDYSALSNLFSLVEGITIEKYIIAQKIERVKELLIYGELSLSAIASKLAYSSTAHLSRQFKKVTGLTPSHFKKIKENRRKPIDEIQTKGI